VPFPGRWCCFRLVAHWRTARATACIQPETNSTTGQYNDRFCIKRLYSIIGTRFSRIMKLLYRFNCHCPFRISKCPSLLLLRLIVRGRSAGVPRVSQSKVSDRVDIETVMIDEDVAGPRLGHFACSKTDASAILSSMTLGTPSYWYARS
jgi:hypothetical protein